MRLQGLTPIQNKFYNDEHRFVVLPSGRRSRKTLISKRKLLNAALRNPGHRYFQAAPTRAQAKSIFWDHLKRDTKLLRKDKSDGELWVKLKNNAEIHVIGLDKPERIEGQPWNGGHISEIANVKDGAWAENIRPVLSDTKGWCILDGVPEGRNHLYDLALLACDGSIPVTVPGEGAYHESQIDKEWAYYSWHSADVLDAGEMLAVKNTLDERTYRQEYEGSFEDVQGLLYWAFGAHNYSDCEYNKNEVVHIGMDFNVNPMTATFSHIRGDEIYQFGEAYLNHSNTYEMVDHIKELFPVNKVKVYPDSTGKAEKSNASRSDIKILEQAGFGVFAKSTNPYIKDRIKTVNSLMMTADGTVRYHINPKNCPKTVNDFNRVESTDDGRENKKQEETGLVHIASAFGYMAHYKFGITSGTVKTLKRH